MIRIYTNQKLYKDAVISLDREQYNYIFNVMRLKILDKINIFNEKQGEWEAELLSRDSAKAVKLLIRPYLMKNKFIAVSMTKQSKLDLIVQKCTELGITNIFLLQADFSNQKRLNAKRLNKIAIEAMEQCGRLCLPCIHSPQPLKTFLDSYANLDLLCLDVGGVEGKTFEGCPIIGPEGGFSKNEMSLMSNLSKIRIAKYTLRMETAAIVAASRIINETQYTQ